MSEPSIDFHKLLVEIDDEVRAKRASGELPADLERELDLVFARYAPAGALEGDFEQLLERAEAQSFFDLLAPNESARRGVPHIKRLVQKSVRWYLRYVVDQVTGFSHTITKAVRLLSERVERIEQLAAPDAELAAVYLRNPPQSAQAWQARIEEALQGTSGRVLHARCGNGTLVEALVRSGVDAYGVEPASSLVGAGVTRMSQSADGLQVDLRPDDVQAHLRLLAPGSLGALVLTDAPDVLPRGAQIDLVDLAAISLTKGGRLLLVVANPAAWQQQRSALEVDLAPGRPLHAATWTHLLEDRGFSSIEVHDAERTGGLARVGDEASNANFERLDALLFPSAGSLIVAFR